VYRVFIGTTVTYRRNKERNLKRKGELQKDEKRKEEKGCEI
jgi:hypothetical protein